MRKKTVFFIITLLIKSLRYEILMQQWKEPLFNLPYRMKMPVSHPFCHRTVFGDDWRSIRHNIWMLNCKCVCLQLNPMLLNPCILLSSTKHIIYVLSPSVDCSILCVGWQRLLFLFLFFLLISSQWPVFNHPWGEKWWRREGAGGGVSHWLSHPFSLFFCSSIELAVREREREREKREEKGRERQGGRERDREADWTVLCRRSSLQLRRRLP